MDLSTITQDHGVFTAKVNFHSALSPFMSGIYTLLKILWFFFFPWALKSIYKGLPENNFSADQPLL